PLASAGSLEEDNITGSRDVGAVAGSFSSPRFSKRRHLKTWFAFTRFARATTATLAPGSNVSSAIRRFSDNVRQRRIGRPTPSSSVTTMTAYSPSHPDSCQRGTRVAYEQNGEFTIDITTCMYPPPANCSAFLPQTT